MRRIRYMLGLLLLALALAIPTIAQAHHSSRCAGRHHHHHGRVCKAHNSKLGSGNVAGDQQGTPSNSQAGDNDQAEDQNEANNPPADDQAEDQSEAGNKQAEDQAEDQNEQQNAADDDQGESSQQGSSGDNGGQHD